VDSVRVVSKKWLPSLLIVLILAVIVPVYLPHLIPSLTSILMYIVLSVSWCMFCAPAGYISLASATFFGVGVYTSAVLGASLPMLVVIACGGLISFLVGLVVGFLCLRLRGFYFAIFTLGLSELVRHSVLWWELHITGTVGRWVVPLDNLTVYYSILSIALMTVLVSYLLGRSKFGLILHSIGQSEEGAAHIGINVAAYRTIVFAVSSFFMGMAGAVMAAKWTYIDPRTAFEPFINFTPPLMALFGGVGQIYGPILGASVLTFASDVLFSRLPYHAMLLYGIILIVVVLFLREGLVGLVKKLHKGLQTE